MAWVDAFIFVVGQTFLNVSAETCKRTSRAEIWLVVLQIVLAEGVLSIRTWAVWRKNKAIGVILVALAGGHLLSQCILVSRFANRIEFSPPPYSGFRGCLPMKAPVALWANYAVMIAVETTVLALMVISAFQSYRIGNESEIWRIIHRDGIIFYIYLLCFTIANLAAIVTLPLDTMDLLSPLQVILYAVLTSRIVLGIREVSGRGSQIELHNDCEEPPVVIMPLELMQEQS